MVTRPLNCEFRRNNRSSRPRSASVVAHLIEQLRHNLEFRFSHTNDQSRSLKESPVPTSHVNDMRSLFAFYRVLPFAQTQLNPWIRHRDR